MKENIDIRLLAAKEAIKSEMFEEAINILDELIAENCSEAMVIRSGMIEIGRASCRERV